jgi:hypothetical protein
MLPSLREHLRLLALAIAMIGMLFCLPHPPHAVFPILIRFELPGPLPLLLSVGVFLRLPASACPPGCRMEREMRFYADGTALLLYQLRQDLPLLKDAALHRAGAQQQPV